jgi:hypothetical protein
MLYTGFLLIKEPNMNDQIVESLVKMNNDDLVELLMEVTLLGGNTEALDRIQHALDVVREGYEDIKNDF